MTERDGSRIKVLFLDYEGTLNDTAASGRLYARDLAAYMQSRHAGHVADWRLAVTSAMGEMRRLQDEQASKAWQGYEAFRRRELRVWAATMLGTAGLPVGGDPELDEFVAEINGNVVPRYVPMPGAVEVLTRLRDRGLRLYVTSGASSEYTTLCLGQAGLAGHFDAILGPDRVAVLKSGVAFYRACLLQAEVAPDQACAVDDSVGPLDWALNAGCYAIGVGAAASALPPRERLSTIDSLGELDRAVILLK